MKSPYTPLGAPLGRLALLCLVAALGACNVVPPAQDDATRYFTLSDSGGSGTPMAHSTGAVRIGLRPVVLDGYLKRRDIVVRTGENEIAFQDYRLWAEPLDSAIGRALASRLLASPAVAQVYQEPFPIEQARDFDVRIEVSRCEGSMARSGRYEASLTATLEIWTAGVDSHAVVRKVFVAPSQEWDGTDYGRLASLLSADVAALGQEVLADLPAKE